MAYKDRGNDIICALSTAIGSGALAVIRISGEDCAITLKKNIPFLPDHPESHRVFFGNFRNKGGESIDEVLVTYFKKGSSYTGEESIEISCHGSQILVSSILNVLIESGCRLADRGEFTFRAFLNGKIDLVQAEGVYSLIQSQNKNSAKQALRQLKGALSKELRDLEKDILWSLANIEASIDFSQEGIETASIDDLLKVLTGVKTKTEKLTNSYQVGKIINNGLHVVFAGAPNVGKSSLFNLLIGHEKAIVTNVPGTTRDALEASIEIDGIRVTLVDTAGIRETNDQVERLGIAKSLSNINESDILIYVIDSNSLLSEEEIEPLKGIPTENLIIVHNKSDLISYESIDNELFKVIAMKLNMGDQALKENVLFVSALNQDHKKLILDKIALHIKNLSLENEEVIIRARHYDNLMLVLRNLESAIFSLKESKSPEFIALDLKEALFTLQETLGEKFDDQIIDKIFREFCIGK